ncbi:hypothetical protein WJX77_012126 [Trebouxia sp. C0004]
MSTMTRRSTQDTQTAGTKTIDMQEKKKFLRDDLTHLFDDQGIDQSAYDDKVKFEDPITKYSSVQGYVFNIKLLRRVFAPTFQLHDIKQTAPHELTTRWTMSMQLTFNKYNPLRRWWDPQLLFTGTSIMGVNPSTGRFNSHVDTWDAVNNQKYLSLEAVRHLLGQLLTFSQAPKLDTPSYTVLKKPSGYEVREYSDFVVAETQMEQASSAGRQAATEQPQKPSSSNSNSSSNSSSGQGKSAFMTLAGYIFGKNERQEKMAMTTPVFSDSSGRMQFFMGTGRDTGSLPAPLDDAVRCIHMPGGTYAVRSFSGMAGEKQAQKQLERLRVAMARDDLQGGATDWTLARYNDPSTKGPFRRNEVLISVTNFDLWGRGVTK